MPLSLAEITALSRLLDEALALPADRRAAWLDGLAAEHRPHAARLRKMLATATGSPADQRLRSLPELMADEAVASPGDSVGAYRLLREIGRGGMGSVWLAERADGAFTRQVALKLPRLAWGAGLAARMAREREIGMRLEHPNIARLYDAGVDERGRPFLALEYVDGSAIDDWCQDRGLDVPQRLQLFVQVVRAVAYAHGRLVIHRDLKPSNVLVTPDGRTQLLDFGVAKLLTEGAPDALGLTQEQGRAMTPQYAAPEQIAGLPITVQSDVYSLGVMLYELLTGSLPFQPRRPSLGALEDAILQGDAPPASSRAGERGTRSALRGDLDAILAKAMQRDPERRYTTADALAQDLERHLRGDTVTARPDSVGYRLGRALRRHWLAVSAGAAVLLALLAGGGVALLQAQRAAAQSERARLATEFVSEIFRASARPTATPGAAAPDPLLDQGARLILTRFPNQPDVQAELYGVVGRIYADLGANTSATDYAQRQLRLLDGMHADPLRLARARMLAADVALRDRRSDDALVHAAEAVKLLSRPDEDWPDALLLLARAQQARGQLAAVRALLDPVTAVLRERGGGPSLALAWAQWLEGEGEPEQQLQARSRGLQTALEAQGPLSSTVVEMRVALAYSQVVNNRAAEGRRQIDAAMAALRSRGGQGEVQAAVADAGYWSAAAMMAAAPPGQAAAEIARDRALIAGSGLPLPADLLAGVDLQLARAHVTNGDLARAAQVLDERVVQQLLQTQSLWRRFDIVAVLGELATWQGRHEAAARWLQERHEVRVRQGRQAAPYAAFDWAFRVANLTLQGEHQAAADLLAQAPRFHALKADPVAGDGYARVLPNERARLLLARGDAPGAEQALPDLPPSMRGDNVGFFSELALHGEVQCALGRSQAGLDLLLRAMHVREAASFVHDPVLARWRAVAGACELARGRRQAARAYAAQARAAFTAQPEISPYFKAPLLKLEQALAPRRQAGT